MTEKIIKGEFDKLKDRLSNLAATYEDKAYDDAINRLYDRLDDLSKEKLNEEAPIYMNYEIPEVKLAGNPPSGKENRRTRRRSELRKKKGRL